MNERKKETEFLKSLILCDESGQGCRLQERIKKAEKDEKCIACALCLVGLLMLFSVSGLAYCAVFVPQFAQYSSHIATKLFSTLGLGSVICFVTFLGYRSWYRAMSNRVYEDCRRFLRTVLESRIKQTLPAAPLPHPEKGTLEVYESETPKSQDEADLFQLSKAS